METLDKLRVALHDRKSKIDTLSLQLRERIHRIEEFEKKIKAANDPETFYKIKMEYLGSPENVKLNERSDNSESMQSVYRTPQVYVSTLGFKGKIFTRDA